MEILQSRNLGHYLAQRDSVMWPARSGRTGKVVDGDVSLSRPRDAVACSERVLMSGGSIVTYQKSPSVIQSIFIGCREAELVCQSAHLQPR